MNSRVSLLSKLSPDRLMVLVVLLGVSFVAIVLLPGLKLAGEAVGVERGRRDQVKPRRRPLAIQQDQSLP